MSLIPGIVATPVFIYSIIEAEEFSGVKTGGRYMEANNRAHGYFT
jgi:hypothetical protein